MNAFLAKASASATQVHLVVYPYHAQMRLMIERAGLGALMAEWKASMLAVSQQATNPATSVQMWDFSAISDETLEPIPKAGDRLTQLRYYWEAGHFKKALGDRVLDRLLRGEGSWGQRLDPPTLDHWLRKDRQSVQRLLAEPSALTREVESLFARSVP